MKAQLNWTSEMQFVGRPENGPGILLDNPEGRSGPSPMELILMGIAGCTAMDAISILKKKRSGFSGVKVDVTGDRADDHPKRYTDIHIDFIITGNDVKPADVARAIELSVTKYCSAIGSVNAKIQTSYRIVEP
ncbi:MAG: OsmC family protein [Desulfobacteraceae bacterium]|nr:OsmC family protein [Desulfobacteraceae bacterium]